MRHGTRSCYVMGCRRPECVEANAAYKRDWKRRAARPDEVTRSAFVPAGETRRHIDELADAGVGLTVVAQRTGLTRRALEKIRSGAQAKVSRRTRALVLGVLPRTDEVANLVTQSSEPPDLDPLWVHDRLASLLAELDQDWRRRAACAEPEIPTEVFYPVRGESAEPAKAVCDRCPVTEECLSFALETGERFGVWGGLSERQRKRMRRDRNLEAAS